MSFAKGLSSEQRIRLYLHDRYRIRERKRMQASRPYGISGTWIEFQIIDGRKIVSRHDTYNQALNAVAALIDLKTQEGLARLRSQP